MIFSRSTQRKNGGHICDILGGKLKKLNKRNIITFINVTPRRYFNSVFGWMIFTEYTLALEVAITERFAVKRLTLGAFVCAVIYRHVHENTIILFHEGACKRLIVGFHVPHCKYTFNVFIL